MLKISNLTKSFKDSFEPILKGINLELKTGDFCIVIGSNGSGKTTLLRTLSGEYTLDKGHVYIAGKDMTHHDRSGMIASVVQDVNQGTIPDMTLLENMVLSQTRGKKATLSFYRRYRDAALAQIREVNIGLEDDIDAPLSKLSGGQRQMVATLMAIQSKPAILLLDEHTAALDPKMQKKLMHYTAEKIRSFGMTAFMITHKLDDAIAYGNRLVMLHHGRIVLDVSGAEKNAYSIQALLALFHQYEDETLLQGASHVG